MAKTKEKGGLFMINPFFKLIAASRGFSRGFSRYLHWFLVNVRLRYASS